MSKVPERIWLELNDNGDADTSRVFTRGDGTGAVEPPADIEYVRVGPPDKVKLSLAEAIALLARAVSLRHDIKRPFYNSTTRIDSGKVEFIEIEFYGEWPERKSTQAAEATQASVNNSDSLEDQRENELK